MFSITKALITLGIGKLDDDGYLCPNPNGNTCKGKGVKTTLGEVFAGTPYIDDFKVEGEEDFLKAVTVSANNYYRSPTLLLYQPVFHAQIEEMITMTSGLRSGVLEYPYVPMNGAEAGDTFAEALTDPYVKDETGAFYPKEYSYLLRNNILSYVIKVLTCMRGATHYKGDSEKCKTPLEYYLEEILPSLGIDRGDSNDATEPFYWEPNGDGLEAAFSRMQMTTRVQAKFGQLYLRKSLRICVSLWLTALTTLVDRHDNRNYAEYGNAGGDQGQLISEAWIDATFTPYVHDTYKGPPVGLDMAIPGGYNWYKIDDCTWFSLALGGQVIAVNHCLHRVVVTHTDIDFPIFSNPEYGYPNEVDEAGTQAMAIVQEIMKEDVLFQVSHIVLCVQSSSVPLV